MTTKFDLQFKHGLTRRQAVNLDKKRDLSTDEFRAELQRVQNYFPRDVPTKSKASVSV